MEHASYARKWPITRCPAGIRSSTGTRSPGSQRRAGKRSEPAGEKQYAIFSKSARDPSAHPVCSSPSTPQSIHPNHARKLTWHAGWGPQGGPSESSFEASSPSRFWTSIPATDTRYPSAVHSLHTFLHIPSSPAPREDAPTSRERRARGSRGLRFPRPCLAERSPSKATAPRPPTSPTASACLRWFSRRPPLPFTPCTGS